MYFFKKKRRFIAIVLCCLFLIPLPVSAAMRPSKFISTVEQLVQCIEDGIGFCMITGPFILDSDLTLSGDSSIAIGSDYREEHAGSNHIKIMDGCTLEIDMPNASFIGNGFSDPVFKVEDGGTLILKHANLEIVVYDSIAPVVEVAEGGVCQISSDVAMGGQYGETYLPRFVQGDGTIEILGDEIPAPTPEPTPGPSDGSDDPDPDIPPMPTSDADIYFAEVTQVIPENTINIFITMPSFSPDLLSFQIERSTDGINWERALFYEHHNDGYYYSEDYTMGTWNSVLQPKSYIHHKEPFNPDLSTVYLRVVMNYSDRYEISPVFTVSLPKSGAATGFIGTRYYEDLDGNRGGGGQGEIDRPIATATPVPTAVPTAIPTAIPTPTASPTPSSVPVTPAPISTLLPAVTPTASPEPTGTPEPSDTPVPVSSTPDSTDVSAEVIDGDSFVPHGFTAALLSTVGIVGLSAAAAFLYHKKH